MGQVLLLVVVALTVAAVVFGVTVLVTGGDQGLGTAEPDGRAVPLPGTRPLAESDVSAVRFDTTVRGYRMGQVDQALRRAAYDIGYKDELIGVLEAEVIALREGRTTDADVLRRAREAALAPAGVGAAPAGAAASAPAGVVDLGEVTPRGDVRPQVDVDKPREYVETARGDVAADIKIDVEEAPETDAPETDAETDAPKTDALKTDDPKTDGADDDTDTDTGVDTGVDTDGAAKAGVSGDDAELPDRDERA
jgi:DivIVA domain-containing protein